MPTVTHQSSDQLHAPVVTVKADFPEKQSGPMAQGLASIDLLKRCCRFVRHSGHGVRLDSWSVIGGGGVNTKRDYSSLFTTDQSPLPPFFRLFGPSQARSSLVS